MSIPVPSAQDVEAALGFLNAEEIAQGRQILAQKTDENAIGVIAEEFLAFLWGRGVVEELKIHCKDIICHPKILSSIPSMRVFPTAHDTCILQSCCFSLDTNVHKNHNSFTKLKFLR